MKYRLANKVELEKARKYLDELIKKQSVVEIKKVNKKRTLSQNSYLHLLLSAFGLHFGYTLQESKLIYKQINADIYEYKKNGRTFYRSSADLTKPDMAKSVDRFMMASAEQGYELPQADDKEWVQELENSIEMQQRYL